MSHVDNALYSPYGAYELKSKYQRNFALGTLSTLAFVLAILSVFWIMAQFEEDVEAIDATAVVIKTVAELGPPPTIAKRPPQVQVNQPNVSAPKVGIPKPVADDEVMDDDVTLATREEMAEIVAPDISTSSSDQDIVVDISEDEYLPAPDEFVPVEEIATMIDYKQPEYPRLAQQAGIEGTVWVKALVGKDGSVLRAMVGKTSGTQSLDDAAVEAAPKNRFRPAIQNGRPVPMWVTYRVDFTLSN
ncbi:MAG: TonB family protein [candidate division Zixibacteria bacterium]|nr:TonB family protein [candidate division Zixibacteria bacterium]